MASSYMPDPDILNFSIGRPVQIAMKYREPKPCATGSRCMISLAGLHPGMRTFVSRAVAEQITQLGITADQPFWIVKRAKDDYEVSLERPENPDERLNRQLRESIARIPAKRATSAASSLHGELPVPIVPPAAPAPDTCSNRGCGKPATQTKPGTGSPICDECAEALTSQEVDAHSLRWRRDAEPASPSAPEPKPIRTQLEAALCTAVQAAHAAQQYAREIGSGMTFTSEDVRAMAITLIIGKQQRERGAA